MIRIVIFSRPPDADERWSAQVIAGILWARLGEAPEGWHTSRRERGVMFYRIGWSECLIILIVLLIVAGLAYRGGYFRGRRRD